MILVPKKLSEEVAQGNLTTTALFVYVSLKSLSEVPNHKRLALYCGLSLSTIEKNLSLLKSRGWIITERAREVHGRSQYWICDVPFERPLP